MISAEDAQRDPGAGDLPIPPANVPRHVLVCQGTGCLSAGADRIAGAMRDCLRRKRQHANVDVKITGCHGFCQQGPIIVVEPDGVFYRRVEPGDVQEIVASHLPGKQLVRRLLYRDPVKKKRIPYYRDIDFYAKQHRLILRNCGRIDPENIEDYEAEGGYQALRKVLAELSPDDAIEEVRRAGLRGRGGGGFPTATKWRTCRDQESDAKYVICNADEGDPGAFMDRSVLEGDPHTVIEGLILAGYAIGAREGIIYCRAEYPLALERLSIALDQAADRGYLGRGILGSTFSFRVSLLNLGEIGADSGSFGPLSGQ